MIAGDDLRSALDRPHMVGRILPPIAGIKIRPPADVPTAMASYDNANRRRLAESLTSRYSDAVLDALDDLPADTRFLISDPALGGHPIVFASPGFLAMTGYSRDEVVGRNGRVFQGPATNRRSVMEIREAIREERTVQISLINYRKDGTPHWILFHLCPIFGTDDDRRVVHFLAVQVPIPRRRSGLPAARSGSRGIVLGACRNEVRDDLGLRCDLNYDSFEDSDSRVLEAEESREAGDTEKQKAASVAKDILAMLKYYRSYMERTVCGGKRVDAAEIAPVSSSLNISLGRIKQSFVLTDPNLPDMPIVYASDAFLTLTGYSRHEVLGRNCRFLNGPGTDNEALEQIKGGHRAQEACSVRVLNYRKDGNSFWNLLQVSPVRNASGKIAYYVWVQLEENSKTEAHGLCPQMRQLGAVGAVKVAVRSLSACSSPSSKSSPS